MFTLSEVVEKINRRAQTRNRPKGPKPSENMKPCWFWDKLSQSGLRHVGVVSIATRLNQNHGDLKRTLTKGEAAAGSLVFQWAKIEGAAASQPGRGDLTETW